MDNSNRSIIVFITIINRCIFALCRKLVTKEVPHRMEFKINVSQIIGAAIQAFAYIVFFLTVTWRASKRVATLESQVTKALEEINKTNTRMEKTFDKIDSTFARMDDKLDRRDERRGRS